ncbi:MAG: hypothetical protein JNM93_12145 [Bacteriovoracaceae bacterium]|nr:hypothetical protein [Bacteriovoracaceae bacterium]
MKFLIIVLLCLPAQAELKKDEMALIKNHVSEIKNINKKTDEKTLRKMFSENFIKKHGGIEKLKTHPILKKIQFDEEYDIQEGFEDKNMVFVRPKKKGHHVWLVLEKENDQFKIDNYMSDMDD